jgi:hypothetical protein
VNERFYESGSFVKIWTFLFDKFYKYAYNICMWKFSNHIQVRMHERNITIEEILAIVNLHANVLIVKSDRDKDIYLYFGRVNQKYILVVVNKTNNNLITTRRMRKSEIKVFKEEMKDE